MSAAFGGSLEPSIGCSAHWIPLNRGLEFVMEGGVLPLSMILNVVRIGHFALGRGVLPLDLQSASDMNKMMPRILMPRMLMSSILVSRIGPSIVKILNVVCIGPCIVKDIEFLISLFLLLDKVFCHWPRMFISMRQPTNDYTSQRPGLNR